MNPETQVLIDQLRDRMAEMSDVERVNLIRDLSDGYFYDEVDWEFKYGDGNTGCRLTLETLP